MRTFRTERFLVEEHAEQAELFHFTTVECVDSIRQRGILPSAFGDLSLGVDGNEDGSGVYALTKETGYDALLEGMKIDGGEIAIVKFLSCGTWYKVIRDFEAEESNVNGDDPINHVGYVVHPCRVPVANLIGIRPI